MQAIILVGGLGTRLRQVVKDRPKPMALVNGKPFLEYVINNLKSMGIKDIILATGYKEDIIREYFGNGEHLGVNIDYSKEESPLGTGGAIKNAERFIKHDEVFVLNGDTYLNVDLKAMMDFHRESKSFFTMALRKVEDGSRYGSVKLAENSQILSFEEKVGLNLNKDKDISKYKWIDERRDINKKNHISDDNCIDKGKYINAGVYLIDSSILNYIEENKNVSLEKDILPDLVKEVYMCGFKFKNYFIDIGIPEDYLKFCEDIKQGVII